MIFYDCLNFKENVFSNAREILIFLPKNCMINFVYIIVFNITNILFNVILFNVFSLLNALINILSELFVDFVAICSVLQVLLDCKFSRHARLPR